MHDARDLMSGYDRIGGKREVAQAYFKIAVTHAASANFDNDFAGFGLRNRTFFDDKRSVRLLGDGNFHDLLSPDL
jgi:hypothetical protein